MNPILMTRRGIWFRSAAAVVAVSMTLSSVSPAIAGGYVFGNRPFTVETSWLTSPALFDIAPTFNNALFTDISLIGSINNDFFRTPSTFDPISTVTGNNFHDETDLVINGREGLNYVFTRTYNSGSRAQDRGVGYGWTHSYLVRLKSIDQGKLPNCKNNATLCPENATGKTSSVIYTNERGGEQSFLVNESGGQAVTRPAGVFDTLTLESPAAGQNTLTFRSGVKYIFENVSADGFSVAPAVSMKTAINVISRLKRIEAPHGGMTLTMGYNSTGGLSTVRDNIGVAGRTGLFFDYTLGRLSAMNDWTGRKWIFDYAPNGDLKSMKNPLLDVLNYGYGADARHLLQEIIKPLDRGVEGKVKTLFKYYQNGRGYSQTNSYLVGDTLDYDLYRHMTRVEDARGGVKEYVYDQNGSLTRLAEQDGGILNFENQDDTLRVKKYDALGFPTSYSYRVDKTYAGASDSFGNVTREMDALGQSIDSTFAYTQLDQALTVRDKNGSLMSATYASSTTATAGVCGDYLNKPKQISIAKLTKADGSAVTNPVLTVYCWNMDATLSYKRDYLDPGSISRYRDSVYTYRPNTNGLLIDKVETVGKPDGNTVTVTFDYDSLGRKKSEQLKRRKSPTDPTLVNITTYYSYDALGRVIEVIDPAGIKILSFYDANGQLWKVTKDTSGVEPDRSVTRTYDAADRIKTETTDVSGKTSYEYDATGNQVSITDSQGHQTRFEYDAMGRRTAVISATGARATTAYNQRGDIVSETNANGEKVGFEYDELRRRIAAVDARNFRTEFKYDANGNLTCVIDANAQAGLQPKNTGDNLSCSTTNVFDELGRLIRSRDANNGVTQFAYDLLGNRLSVKDPENKTWSFAYDDLGRLKSETDHAGKSLLYKVDQAGNVYETVNRLSETTQYTVDNVSRVTSVNFLKDGTSEAQSYNPGGSLSTSGNDLLTYNLKYDSAGRLKSKTDSRGRSLSFTYDGVGNIRTKTTYQGSTTTYQYNADNRLVQLSNPDYLQVDYQYDPAGRMLSRLMSSGARSAYAYDANGWLSTLTHQDAANATVISTAYTRDRVGNVLTQIDTGGPNPGTSTFELDPLYRLKTADYPGSVNDEAFGYDNVGNRTTYTKGALVAGPSTRYYQYTSGTNRLAEIRIGSTTGTLETSFANDLEGRLTAQVGVGAKTLTWDAKGRVKTVGAEAYSYDPQNHRVARSGGSLGNRDYFLEGEHLESVYSAGAVVGKYFRGSSVDELVAGYQYDDGKLKPVLFHHDGLTSTAALTGVNGTTIQSASYGAFGGTLATAGASSNRLKYTGREDDGSGLYYYRARYYDAAVGRFISEDPMGFGAGVNFYAYVGNNPINANDPSGNFLAALAAIEPALAWVAGVGRVAMPFLARSAVPAVTAGSLAAVGTKVTGGSNSDAGISFGVAVGATYAMPIMGISSATTFAGLARQGMATAAISDGISQGIGMQFDESKKYNYGQTAGATFAGLANVLTLGAGSNALQQNITNIITSPLGWVVPKLGEQLWAPSPSGGTDFKPQFPGVAGGASFMATVYGCP